MCTRRPAKPTRSWSTADVEEMITMFQVNGAMIYVDPDGGVLGYEDVFSKIDACRERITPASALGEGFVDQFIR